MKRIRRESWAILLVVMHLFVAPCATAMLLMPADMDCEHCQTINSPDDCAVASAATGAVIEGVAFDSGANSGRANSGRADPPLRAAELPPESSRAVPLAQWSRAVATRHSGDPPLYLLLGQLRI